MKYRIEEIESFKIQGRSTRMSLVENKTHQLWSGFMKELSSKGEDVEQVKYSVEIYDGLDYFETFNPTNEFTKSAGVVTDKLLGMELIEIPSGKYLVYDYKGKPSEAFNFFQYFFQEFLPSSEFELDDRPHMAIMDERYLGEDPESQEEFWIPIK